MLKIQQDQRTNDQTKEQYRITNWSAYNLGLENQGNVTLYFDEDAITDWYSEGAQNNLSQREICI